MRFSAGSRNHESACVNPLWRVHASEQDSTRAEHAGAYGAAGRRGVQTLHVSLLFLYLLPPLPHRHSKCRLRREPALTTVSFILSAPRGASTGLMTAPVTHAFATAEETTRRGRAYQTVTVHVRRPPPPFFVFVVSGTPIEKNAFFPSAARRYYQGYARRPFVPPQ